MSLVTPATSEVLCRRESGLLRNRARGNYAQLLECSDLFWVLMVLCEPVNAEVLFYEHCFKF